MVFFELFSTGFMCVCYGILITLILMALLYSALRLLNRGIVSSIPFYITGVFLFLLLVVQFSLMMGAFEVKGYIEGVESYVTQLVGGMTGVLDAQESQMILEKVTDQYPLLEVYLDTYNFSGKEIEGLPAAVAGILRENLVGYIWHRVWWVVGLVIVASVIAIITRKRPATYNFDSSLEYLGIY